MKVSECMTRDVEIANPDMSLREAAKLMADCDAGALPVGENDRLVGILTDRDITIRAVANGRGPDAKIRDIMSGDVCWCYEDETSTTPCSNLLKSRSGECPCSAGRSGWWASSPLAI